MLREFEHGLGLVGARVKLILDFIFEVLGHVGLEQAVENSKVVYLPLICSCLVSETKKVVEVVLGFLLGRLVGTDDAIFNLVAH